MVREWCVAAKGRVKRQHRVKILVHVQLTEGGSTSRRPERGSQPHSYPRKTQKVANVKIVRKRGLGKISGGMWSPSGVGQKIKRRLQADVIMREFRGVVIRLMTPFGIVFSVFLDAGANKSLTHTQKLSGFFEGPPIGCAKKYPVVRKRCVRHYYCHSWPCTRSRPSFAAGRISS